MSFTQWLTKSETVFCSSPVIPVVQIKKIEHTIPLATALFAGGMNAIEVTLRTPIALDAVRLLNQTFPEALVGVGTVINPEQLYESINAGAQFAFSPGSTQALLEAGCRSSIPFFPGITSISEVMDGIAMGYTHFKFFPAIAAGGVPLLKAFSGPFPQAKFCATGGITEINAGEFLAQDNVICVGGSWMIPDEAVKSNNWSKITELCLAARQGVRGWDY